VHDWNQEAYYNVARAFHHLNLLPWATQMYEKVLQLRPGPKKDDLAVEAAYNLSLIYAKSNPMLAKKLLRQYVVF